MAQLRRFDAELAGRLFPETPHFRLAVLGRDDARRNSDDGRTGGVEISRPAVPTVGPPTVGFTTGSAAAG